MDRVVFDSIPLDDLEVGQRYLFQRADGMPFAGEFLGIGSTRGQSLRLIVRLIGGECVLNAARIARIMHEE